MAEDRLLQAQRHERLLGRLRDSGAIRVRELARDLGVSELTIRRDIAALAARNLVTRVHGGATLPSPARPVVRPRQAWTVGMVVPSLDFYWPPIVAGARAAAAALGVTIQLRGSSYDPEEDRRQIGRLVEARQVQGLLLAPLLKSPDADRIIDWIGGLPIPAVLVERQPRHWSPAARRIEWVRSDHSRGLEMAVHHLRDQGHSRIGLVLSEGSPTSAYLSRSWAELGLPVAMVFADPSSAVRACSGAGPTALVVHSDPDAIAIARTGLNIALVSYDDEVAHLADPPLTAIRPPKNHVGRIAVELMVSRLLSGDRRPAQGVLVAPELVVRESSRARVVRV
ncbi:substrate-binding domain-containing protein [Actinoplanes regularis]|uniref:DNA-binding transcriptional regulator, LacI/PurR family n=1 Tax=Actinoplanes regularis TaxID=52697 RepID=A0A238W532_9ACTN|nr:LacI family DNA-binding transcriptional regulator [Actinoplanes regularis]GIE85266.1 LacI family transcriptional regulator [Actinoplanes regularis]SNR41434.1 DNA-binding transcriptional regulator, LacI/PurR family [Actinoplanes regularis]